MPSQCSEVRKVQAGSMTQSVYIYISYVVKQAHINYKIEHNLRKMGVLAISKLTRRFMFLYKLVA